MQYKVVYTNHFNGYLRGLLQSGQPKIVQAARAAITEAAMSGEIQSLPRTKHGETRLQDVEKYALADGYRLIVQLVDGKQKIRAFLFVGTHDDTDRWLDNHRNYKWTKNNNDGTLEFVQVTEREDQRYIPADRIDLESPEDLLELPLLRVLTSEQWALLRLPTIAQQYISTISAYDYERDAEGILTRVDDLAGWEKTALLIDLLAHAHAGEWHQLHHRLDVISGGASVVEVEEIASAMLSRDNSEAFVTFDDPADLDNFFANHSMADWMLFLHPEQKRVSERDFRGPARLRGVSGSGKTSVLVHRARYLAKHYRQPVLLITLTESMRKLLDHLVDDLCGVERSLIVSMTMSSLARHVVHELHSDRSSPLTLVGQEELDVILSSIARQIRDTTDLARTPLGAMEHDALVSFLRDEISYVRGRLRPNELSQYLDPQLFQRRGRGSALGESGRAIVLHAMQLYNQKLLAQNLSDHEGIVAEALTLLDSDRREFNKPRCILCDEVQDLSQLEVALLGRIPTPTGERIGNVENALFLAGDGAQTIYRRGFTLGRLGIDITGRSFTLRKNYRNTCEILTAAFGLVSEYEFADVDEENIVKPTEPEFAKRHGSRPLIVRCSSLTEEAAMVAEKVRSDLVCGQTPGQICIVGPNAKIREEVRSALSRLRVAHTDLRLDADYESAQVKVSTIESAKGHEFSAVFIMGLVEGVLPNGGVADNELPREAARMYVAMTRARDRLTLSYSPNMQYAASRFLLAIQPHCDEARVRDGEIYRIGSV